MIEEKCIDLGKITERKSAQAAANAAAAEFAASAAAAAKRHADMMIPDGRAGDVWSHRTDSIGWH